MPPINFELECRVKILWLWFFFIPKRIAHSSCSKFFNAISNCNYKFKSSRVQLHKFWILKLTFKIFHSSLVDAKKRCSNLPLKRPVTDDKSYCVSIVKIICLCIKPYQKLHLNLGLPIDSYMVETKFTKTGVVRSHFYGFFTT